MNGYSDLKELDQYADEFPDERALTVWIENGVAMYIVVNQMFRSAKERDESERRIKESGLGEAMALISEVTGREVPPMPLRWYNGYCRFKEVPLFGTAILQYVPVYGGVSCHKRSNTDGSYVYGFDTNHIDRTPEMNTTEWLKNECGKMAFAITSAIPYEQEYLKASSRTEKRRIIDNYLSFVCKECDAAEPGMGAILHMMIDSFEEDEEE